MIYIIAIFKVNFSLVWYIRIYNKSYKKEKK